MTFWRAQERAQAAGGKLILRIEDIDHLRCRSEFTDAIIEDLHWFGLRWDEGPDVGGRFTPYVQNERRNYCLGALEKLRAGGFIYPCICSRKDVLGAAAAPHDDNKEPIYPGTCRPRSDATSASSVVAAQIPGGKGASPATGLPLRTAAATTVKTNWRFRVPDGDKLSFVDGRLGLQTAIAGRDFGDFIVWRRDDVPAYQLAVAVDDAAMKITEVVRGEDLLLSTFRQLLIYRALNLMAPDFFHAPLILDENGQRFAKRDGSETLRALRARGVTPEQLRIGSGAL